MCNWARPLGWREAELQRHAACAGFEPPMVILTGDTEPQRISQAQRVGATLLHKPIDTQTLYGELRKAHAARRAPTGG